MKKTPKLLSPYKRKIIINKETWTYRVTRTYLFICNPQRTKKWRKQIDLSLKDPHFCEGDDDCSSCAFELGPSQEALTPGMVREIITNFLN